LSVSGLSQQPQISCATHATLDVPLLCGRDAGQPSGDDFAIFRHETPQNFNVIDVNHSVWIQITCTTSRTRILGPILVPVSFSPNHCHAFFLFVVDSITLLERQVVCIRLFI
jgi:hypothetical protein